MEKTIGKNAVGLEIYDGDGKNISENVTLLNGKMNPFGWSQYEMWYNGKRIGWLESGYPDIEEPFYYEDNRK